MKTALVLVAAGRGVRAGGDLPKQYRLLAGAPVMRRAAMAFGGIDGLDVLVAVIAPGDQPMAQAALADLPFKRCSQPAAQRASNPCSTV
ncbi:MAG: hypothetical protein HC779_07210 [Phyllobacteriaceae bacterium]|nr:hypothetical protein [Phyllobacteriaceae bacterium]